MRKRPIFPPYVNDPQKAHTRYMYIANQSQSLSKMQNEIFLIRLFLIFEVGCHVFPS